MRNKKAISPVISTVLLIFVAVAAIVLIANFIIPWIKDSLSGTSCFKAIDMLEILEDETYTCVGGGEARVMIQIGIGEVEVEGILVALTGEGSSDSFRIKNNTLVENVRMYDKTYNDVVEIPNQGEARTYVFDISGLTGVEKAEAAIILENDKVCEAVEAELPIC